MFVCRCDIFQEDVKGVDLLLRHRCGAYRVEDLVATRKLRGQRGDVCKGDEGVLGKGSKVFFGFEGFDDISPEFFLETLGRAGDIDLDKQVSLFESGM